MAIIQDSLFGRMFPEHSAATGAETSPPFSKTWLEQRYLSLKMVGQAQVLLLDPRDKRLGELLMHNFGESPNVVVESTLSQILEDNVPAKYYLSPKACQGILRRAEKRGKKLPPLLEQALTAQAQELPGPSPENGQKEPIAFNGRQDPVYGKVTGSLDTDRATQCVVHPRSTGTLCASGAGMSRPADMASETDLLVCAPVTFTPGNLSRGSGPKPNDKVSPTLGATAQGDQFPHIAFAVNQRDEVRDLGEKSGAIQAQPGMKQQTFIIQSATTDGPCYTLDCRADHAVVYPEPANTLLGKANMSHRPDTDKVVRIGYAVRRLTPIECERLQGLEDNWTAGGSDTARYKAIGNSLAKPNAKFVIQNIKRVLRR